MEDKNVTFKDKEALKWCANVQNLTGKKWRYLKVRKKDLENYQSQDFRTLAKGTEVNSDPPKTVSDVGERTAVHEQDGA